jgi:FixJ family two-component response regulator
MSSRSRSKRAVKISANRVSPKETSRARVVLLDGDAATRQRLARMLRKRGYEVECHPGPDEWVGAAGSGFPCCMLIEHPCNNGKCATDVVNGLRSKGWNFPVVFLAREWSLRTVVRAVKGGADGFLGKPVTERELAETIDEVLGGPERRPVNSRMAEEARRRVKTLTPRKREVVRWVAAGLLNKEIAEKLGLALVTVKVHRGRAVRKLGAGNPAALVRIASLAGLLH